MNLSRVALPLTIIISYLIFRILVPWLREQATIAKAIADNKQEAPDLDKAMSELMDAIKDKEEQ